MSSAVSEQRYQEILVEFEFLKGEITRYHELRQKTLTMVVTAIGGLLAFGSDGRSNSVGAAMFLVIVIGVLLTRQFHFEILKRIAYLCVAIEPELEGSRWFRALSGMSLRISDSKLFGIPKWVFPQAYPVSYALLGVSISIHGLAFTDHFALTISQIAISWTVLIPMCILMQRANSSEEFSVLKDMWKKSVLVREIKENEQ